VRWVKCKLASVYMEMVLISIYDRWTVCVKWKLVSVSFEIVLISTQDRCTVCAEHAIGSEIILGAHDRTLR
jgi:hypothetical protein